MIVNQWVPAAHVGDAVGDHARALRGLFRAWGYESEIYAIDIDERLAGEVRPWTHPWARVGSVTILHFATASPMTEDFAGLAGTRVVHYHNVTPAHFFAKYDPTLCHVTRQARLELASLAGRTDVAYGASRFSCEELNALGFPAPSVLPLVVDLDRLRSARPVPSLERVLDDGPANILFVGRLAPNKKIEDHLRLAEQYRRYIDLDCRFIFVGRSDAVPAYFTALRALVLAHGLPPDRVWFTGPVPTAELAAYYRHADAYVSLSEHEGFGAPLVEAMAMDVPVLAYAATAVPETLDGAGLAFAPKDLEYAAELLGAVVYDEPLRESVLKGQQARVREFEPGRIAERAKAALATAGL